MRNHLGLLVGVVGVLYLLFPRKAVALWTHLGYRGRVDAEPREWVYDAARVEGAILTVLALKSLFRAAETDDSGQANADGSPVESPIGGGE
ncbi:MAG: hypothetical protein ABEH81_05485 [Halopenitus sp.]